MFYKEIDTSSKEAMQEFIKDHFKYHVMNPWNGMQTFAHNVKLHKLDLPNIDKAFELIDCEEFGNLLYEPYFEDFSERHPIYVLGTNGRSNGYIILTSMDRRGRFYDTEEQN